MTRHVTRPQTTPPRARRSPVLLVLAALAFAVLVSSAQAAVPRSFWGVGSQTPLTDADLDRMGEGNVGTVRIPIFWTEVDPSAAAGDTNWASIDPVVAGAARNGVEVLPFIFGTPAWVAQDLEGRKCQPAKCAITPPAKKAGLAAWETFVGEVVARYGPNGTFWVENPSLPKVPFGAYQIWNEQNSTSFFAPKASPKGYAKLLGAAADAIRPADAAADVVLGGMPQLAGSKKAIEATEYLHDFYGVPGVEADFDGVAIHPYGASLQKVADQVELFRKEMKQAGDASTGLWVTEIGAGSKSGGNPLNRGLKGQANLLEQTFKYFEKNSKKMKIQNVSWFSWMDSKVSICEWCGTSGLFKKGLKEKPSWKAFTKFTGGS